MLTEQNHSFKRFKEKEKQSSWRKTMENQTTILHRILDNIEQVIVGKRESVEMVLMALLCDSHVLIEDIPGVGKTSLARA